MGMIEVVEQATPLVATILTAVTPIVLAVLANGKKDRAQGRENSKLLCDTMVKLKGSLDRMDNRIEVLEGYSKEDYRRILVMEIMEENLPIEERLKAGEKYIAHGWNGPIKALYESLLEQYRQDLKKD